MLGHLQALQSNAQQQNLQQQQPSQQQQQGQQQSGPQSSIPPPPPQNGQDFTLSSVLHFLQTEWRRYERDRNEWEIERAEMRVTTFFLFTLFTAHCASQFHLQARIALLEGERRSFENVKLDLMRRIRMLEYALRMERSVFPSQFNVDHVNDWLHIVRSSSHSRLHNQYLSQNFIPMLRHRRKRTKRKRAAGVHHGARVCLSTASRQDIERLTLF